MASERAQLVARVLERKWEDIDEQSVAEHIEAAFQTEREEARKQAAINLIDIANQSLNFADFKCRAMEYGGLTLADFQPREETEGDDIDSAMEAEKNG